MLLKLLFKKKFLKPSQGVSLVLTVGFLPLSKNILVAELVVSLGVNKCVKECVIGVLFMLFNPASGLNVSRIGCRSTADICFYEQACEFFNIRSHAWFTEWLVPYLWCIFFGFGVLLIGSYPDQDKLWWRSEG